MSDKITLSQAVKSSFFSDLYESGDLARKFGGAATFNAYTEFMAGLDGVYFEIMRELTPLRKSVLNATINLCSRQEQYGAIPLQEIARVTHRAPSQLKTMLPTIEKSVIKGINSYNKRYSASLRAEDYHLFAVEQDGVVVEDSLFAAYARLMRTSRACPESELVPAWLDYKGLE